MMKRRRKKPVMTRLRKKLLRMPQKNQLPVTPSKLLKPLLPQSKPLKQLLPLN
jgi:hypothetical protein